MGRVRGRCLLALLLPLGAAACGSGTTATTAPTSSSSGAVATIDSCLVGTWTATSVTLLAGEASGLAGMTMTIQSGGKTVLDLSNATPMDIPDAGTTNTFTGTDTFTMTSGQGQTDITTDQTNLDYTIASPGGGATKPLGEPFFDASTYTCSSTSLTMNFNVGQEGTYLTGYVATFTK